MKADPHAVRDYEWIEPAKQSALGLRCILGIINSLIIIMLTTTTPPPPPPPPTLLLLLLLLLLHVFVATKQVFCRDKSMLAATTVLSRQNYVCRDKIFVATHPCLSRQQFCLDKHTFVSESKMILVAAPANNTHAHARRRTEAM